MIAKDANNCIGVSSTITVAACGPIDVTKCYKIKNRSSNLYLNMNSGSSSSGTKAIQSTGANTQSQKFKFTLVQTVGSTKYYSIINVNSNLALGADGGSTSDNKQIKQTAYTGADYQKWTVTVSGSYLIFKAKHSGKSMTVLSNSNSNGADVVQKTSSNNSEQWSISSISCTATASKSSDPSITEADEVDARDVAVTDNDDAISKVKELTISASPNPGTSFFNLRIQSNDNVSRVDVRVLDIDGRVLWMHKAVPNSILKIAADKWKGGMYFVEVGQGAKRKVIKVAKMNSIN